MVELKSRYKKSSDYGCKECQTSKRHTHADLFKYTETKVRRGSLHVSQKGLSTEMYVFKGWHSLSSEIEKKFGVLASNWKKETGAYSTSIHITSNANYLGIIGMGKEALPLILNDLRKESSLWFAALKAITKENPVQKEDIGNMERMRQAWLSWGKKNQLI